MILPPSALDTRIGYRHHQAIPLRWLTWRSKVSRRFVIHARLCVMVAGTTSWFTERTGWGGGNRRRTDRCRRDGFVFDRFISRWNRCGRWDTAQSAQALIRNFTCQDWPWSEWNIHRCIIDFGFFQWNLRFMVQARRRRTATQLNHFENRTIFDIARSMRRTRRVLFYDVHWHLLNKGDSLPDLFQLIENIFVRFTYVNAGIVGIHLFHGQLMRKGSLNNARAWDNRRGRESRARKPDDINPFSSSSLWSSELVSLSSCGFVDENEKWTGKEKDNLPNK